MLDRVTITTGAASGGAGAATATGYSPTVSGRVLAVYVAYSGTPPATTDVTLQDDDDPAEENIVNLADNNTDTKLYPRRQVEDNADNDLTYDGTRGVYEPYVVHGRLKATIAQANDDDSAEVTVWLKRD